MKDGRANAEILVAVAALMFGFLGLCSRRLAEYGLGPYEISLVRSLLTVAVFFIYILVTKPAGFRVALKDAWIMVVFGILKFLSDATFFMAQRDITLAMATLLQMTSPYFVMIVSLFLFRERITLKKAMAMMCAFLGLLMVCDLLNGDNSIAVDGAMAGVASGYFIAMYLIGNRISLNRGYSAETTMFWFFLAALLVNIPFADCGAIADAAVIPEAILYMVILGVVLTALPFFVFNWAMVRISPATVSVLTVLEAVSAGIVGLVFFGEELSTTKIIGMSVVLVSVVLMNVRISKGLRKRLEENA